MRMTKSLFIGATFVFAAVNWAAAQPQTGKMPRVGIIGGSSAEAAKRNLDAFRDGMRKLGWVDGKNVIFEYRHADGDPSRLDALAAELVKLPVEVILAGGTQTTVAAKRRPARYRLWLEPREILSGPA